MTTQVREDLASTRKSLFLIVVGIAVLSAVTYLEFRNVKYTPTKVVDTVKTTTDTKVTTTSTNTAVSDTLLTAAASFCAVILLAGAFFGRLTKLLLPGGIELDFDTTAAIGAKASQATGGDASKTKKLAKAATKSATDFAQISSKRPDAAGYVSLENDDIGRIVLETAEELGIEVLEAHKTAVRANLV